MHCMNNIETLDKNIAFTVFMRPEPEGGFTVLVPALPGCVTYGKDLVEAKRMAVDVIEAYIASLKKHNEPIPSEDENFITSIRVRRPSRQRSRVHA